MLNVQGSLIQKKEYKPYTKQISNIKRNGENYCDSTNGVEDWMYKYEKNVFSPDVAYCSKPDVGLCEIENFPATASWISTRSPVDKFPTIACQYEAQKIKNIYQVNKWVDKFGHNEWYDKLMFEFCSLLQDDCSLPSPVKACSFKNSRSTDATYCSLWFNGLKKNFISQTFMDFICKKHPTLHECRCINRSLDPLFLSIKGGDKSKMAFGDNCWYSPCTNEFQNFVPNGILEAKCPDTVCATILNFIDVNSVKMKDLSTVINCNTNFAGAYFLSQEFWGPIMDYMFNNHVVFIIGFFIILGLIGLFFFSIPVFMYRRISRMPDPTEEENNYDIVIS